MIILKLTVENFMKLSAIEITPDGNMVIISGKNDAGKSCALNSIEATLRGGRCLPKTPIKRGEIRGKTETILGKVAPEYKVTRKYFGSTSNLVVETMGETKAEISSPQTFLDNVVGELSFDPLAFLNKQPAEQRNIILDFLGLNLEEFANKIATIKTRRSEIRKDKEKLLHEANSLVFTPNLPPQEISSESLLKELADIGNHNRECHVFVTRNAVTHQKLLDITKDLDAAQAAVEGWQKKVDSLQQQKATLDAQVSTTTNPPPKSTVEVEGKLKTLDATNAAIRTNIQKKKAVEDYNGCMAEYTKLGDEIKIVENQKTRKLTEAVMPVEGLTILPDGLGYKDLPLEQECESKQLKICVAIAMAMNPKLKVLRIDGNCLDKDSLKTINELVAGTDYQIWVEKVSDDDKIGFYIEDGQLTGA